MALHKKAVADTIYWVSSVLVLLQPGYASVFFVQSLVELVNAQFAVDTVIKRVQTAAAVNFDTSTSALVELKKAGVDERIIVAMLERSKDSPEGKPGPDASPPAAARGFGRANEPKDAAAKGVEVAPKEPAKKKGVRAGSFTFDLGGCKASGDRVTCELMITNTDNIEKEIEFTLAGNSSTMIDDKGNERKASESRIADRIDRQAMPLAPSIPVSAKVVFEGLQEQARSLNPPESLTSCQKPSPLYSIHSDRPFSRTALG